MRLISFVLILSVQLGAYAFEENLSFEKGQVISCRNTADQNYGAVFTGLGDGKVKLNAITNNLVEADDKAEYFEIRASGADDLIYMVSKHVYFDLKVGTQYEIVFLKRKTADEALSAMLQLSEFTVVKGADGKPVESDFVVVAAMSYLCQDK
jgi:hypothetical protein